MKVICLRMIRGNRGDLASRYGILAQLHDYNVKNVTVFCDNQSDIGQLPFKKMPYGLLFNLFLGLEGLKELLSAKVVIWTAGIDLQDDSSILKLLHTACAFTFYRLLGKKIIIIMQGAGPITSNCGKFIVKLIVRLTNHFLVRDGGSFQLLKKISGNSKKLISAYDGIFCTAFTNILHEEGKTYSQNKMRGDQLTIGFNIRLWYHFSRNILPYHLRKNAYQKRAGSKMNELIASSVKSITNLLSSLNAKIILISMYETGSMVWEDDMPFLKQIKSHFSSDDRVEILGEPMDLQTFCTSISRLNMMIGMRLHATLIALRFGVPSINLNYTLKGRDMFNDMGLSKYVIEIDDFIRAPEDLHNRVSQALCDNYLKDQIKTFINKAGEHNSLSLKSILTNL